MKKFKVILVHKTYYEFEVEAEDNLGAVTAAYDVDTTMLKPVEQQADVYDVNEVTE